jgi:hypothetical protein
MPNGEYDATIPMLRYHQVYDLDHKPWPFILLDAGGHPRTDVVYEAGVPYDVQGHRLDADGRRIEREP